METLDLEHGRPEAELEGLLEAVVARASEQCRAFEARAEVSRSLSASWHDGGFRMFKESRLAGVCLRVWVDGAEGFASSHDPSPSAVESMVEHARAIAQANADRDAPGFPYTPEGRRPATYRPAVDMLPVDEDPARIAELLARVEEATLEVDPSAYARPQFATTSRRVLFEDAQGVRVDHASLLSTLQGGSLHRDGDRPGESILSIAGERGLDDFEDQGGPEGLGRRSAELAREAASAKPAPAGRHRVLCDPTLSGLLAHESFGHLTEYDLVSMGWSRLAGRIGDRFSDLPIDIVDAPVAPAGHAGGLRVPYDEEGTEGEEVRILEDGVLKRWLHKRGSAPESDQAPTGNARAFNVRFPPIVRMRNTYIEPGDHSLEELLEALGDGVYLVGARGGQPISDGSFTFTAERGYLVEDGELGDPVRPTTISGNIVDFLQGVEALGDDLEIRTTNFGGCGKWGQSFLPVGTGGPHVLVDHPLIGGTG